MRTSREGFEGPFPWRLVAFVAVVLVAGLTIGALLA